MKGKGTWLNTAVLFLVLIFFTLTGCGDEQINSKWRTQKITIDGDDSDWGNSLVFYDDLNSLVGVQNDNDNLYLCLVTSDQQIERKVFMGGLIVWFDNTGKGDKKFGIKFPLRNKNMDKDAFKPGDDQGEGRRREGDEGREGPGDNGRQGFSEQDRDRMQTMFLKNQTDIEIVDSHNETNRVPISELKGVELKMSVKNYRMVYEMKIPLSMKSGISYAVGTNVNSTISVGLETGTIEMKKPKTLKERNAEQGSDQGDQGEGMEGGMGGGDDYGSEGGGRSRGGRRGGMPGDFNSGSMQPLKFWADIKLNNGASK